MNVLKYLKSDLSCTPNNRVCIPIFLCMCAWQLSLTFRVLPRSSVFHPECVFCFVPLCEAQALGHFAWTLFDSLLWLRGLPPGALRGTAFLFQAGLTTAQQTQWSTTRQTKKKQRKQTNHLEPTHLEVFFQCGNHPVLKRKYPVNYINDHILQKKSIFVCLALIEISVLGINFFCKIYAFCKIKKK